jgi:hypothetical protein
MNPTRILIGTLLGLAACAAPDDDGASSATAVDTVELASDSPIERHLPDTLVNTTVLDTLHGASGQAWFVIAGVECANCDAPETLWLTRDLARGPEYGPYDYPGDDFEMGVEGGEPYGRGRLFTGNCLPESGDRRTDRGPRRCTSCISPTRR